MGFRHILDQRNLFRGVLEIRIRQSLRRQPVHGGARVEHTTEYQSDEPVVAEVRIPHAHEATSVEKRSFFPRGGVASLPHRSKRENRPEPSKRLDAPEPEVSLFNRMLKGVTLILAPVKS
jgi:hypothetical protein